MYVVASTKFVTLANMHPDVHIPAVFYLERCVTHFLNKVANFMSVVLIWSENLSELCVL